MLVTVHGGIQGSEMFTLAHFLENGLKYGGKGVSLMR
jgi:hypothetical protein